MSTIIRSLPPETVRDLSRRSDWQGALDVLVDWGIIAGAFALVAAWPNPLTVVVAIALIGGRQLGLAVLTHEATHYSLFRTRRLNDLVSNWLCAYPIWADTIRYRQEHMQHHRLTGTDDDPDIGLVRPYPAPARALWRRCVRDLLGITAVKRAYGLLLIDFGFLNYTMSTNARPIPGAGARSLPQILAAGIPRVGPVLLVNTLLFAILWLIGHPWLYLLWVGAWATTYSLFIRLRSIAEHAGTPEREDALNNTRTTLAGPVARLFLAPHHVNFHLEHHLIMAVPHHRLAALRRLLLEHRALDGACVVKGYRRALGQAIVRSR